MAAIHLFGLLFVTFISKSWPSAAKNETIYKEPIPGKKPPLWIRMILWTTCGLVSFFHGQNDGQKGVGLVMIILIAIIPGYFSINEKINIQSINANIEHIQQSKLVCNHV